MDVRAYGKGYEEYYERAKSAGVRSCGGGGCYLMVRADANGLGIQIENTETGAIEILRPDLVVLSVGIQPVDTTAALADMLGITREDTGFFRSAHDAMDP